jgi:NADH-quinone oxidoreductase subunit C
MIDLKKLIDELKPSNKNEIQLSEDGSSIVISRSIIFEILYDLKNKFNFKMLIDITAVDFIDKLQVVYHLMNMKNAEMIRLKVNLTNEDPKIQSAVRLWKTAEVLEREVFDLMGILFDGLDNYNRILNCDDFIGHPLRKDFKLDVLDKIKD